MNREPRWKIGYPKRTNQYVVLRQGRPEILSFTKSMSQMKKMNTMIPEGVWYREENSNYSLFYDIDYWMSLPDYPEDYIK